MSVARRQSPQGIEAVLAAAWRGLSRNSTRAVLARCQSVHLARGQTYAADGLGRMCVVSNGRLHVYYKRTGRPDNDALAGLVCPGDFFAAGVDSRTGRLTVAQARTDSRIIAMRYEDAYQLAMTYPDFNLLVLAALVTMTESMGQRIESLLIGDAAGRVGWALGELVAKFGRPVPDGYELRHRVTQSELAMLSGVTRETANKTISEFVARGWASMRGHSIVVHDLEALRRLAG